MNSFNVLLNLYLLISIPIYWNMRRWDMLQSIYFVFGIFALLIVSEFMLTKKRDFNNVWAGGLLLISLSSIFLHNFFVSKTTEKFLSFSLMSEGFIYLFSGLIFFKLVYEYGSSRIKDYPVLWLALFLWIVKSFMDLSITPIASMALMTAIYLFRIKNIYVYTYLFGLLVITVIGFNYLYDSFQSRIWTNAVLFKSTLVNPFGAGFDNSLNGGMIFCRLPYTKINEALKIGTVEGFVWPHNDFLNIAKDLGVPALVCIIFGLYELFKGAKKEPLTYLCLAIVLTSFFQTTFYFTNSLRFIPLFSLMGIRKL